MGLCSSVAAVKRVPELAADTSQQCSNPESVEPTDQDGDTRSADQIHQIKILGEFSSALVEQKLSLTLPQIEATNAPTADAESVRVYEADAFAFKEEDICQQIVSPLLTRLRGQHADSSNEDIPRVSIRLNVSCLNVSGEGSSTKRVCNPSRQYTYTYTRDSVVPRVRVSLDDLIQGRNVTLNPNHLHHHAKTIRMHLDLSAVMVP